MVDITITAANVVGGSDRFRSTEIAGEAITAGKAVYRSSSTGKMMLADSNSVTAEARKPLGIALNGAAVNQPVVYQTSGDITIGATLTPGLAYYLSDTPGGICPVADVGAGEYVCLVGMAKSATVLSMNIQAPGVAL